MNKFKSLTAQAAPLLRPNIDTDVIIRIERLAAHKRAELGRFAFEAWRFRPDGSESPDFILNTDLYRGSPILLAGSNFGCGSSREHAVWALQGLGLRCIVAPSFGDIFYGNCFQNGMLPVTLKPEEVAEIAADVQATAPAPMTVDLERQVVVAPRGRTYAFDLDPARRLQLLEGLDQIGMTLRQTALIQQFEQADRARRPWIYLRAAP